MNKRSNSLIHRFNNNFSTLLTAIEAIEANIENHDYIKEVFKEILNKKEDFELTLSDMREALERTEI